MFPAIIINTRLTTVHSHTPTKLIGQQKQSGEVLDRSRRRTLCSDSLAGTLTMLGCESGRTSNAAAVQSRGLSRVQLCYE